MSKKKNSSKKKRSSKKNKSLAKKAGSSAVSANQSVLSKTSAKSSASFQPKFVDGRPLLSLAMMVKNEEEFLEDALKSVQHIADELVVVDTGSTDRTVEIAHSFNAKVVHYEWKDDFSDARNETIRQSSGHWVLILDADERVDMNPKYLAQLRKGLIENLNQGPYVGISVNVINIRLDGSVMNSLPSVRMFPNAPDKVCYRNRVHNQLKPVKPGQEFTIKLCDFFDIKHLGYDPTVYEKRKKTERSLPLILKMLEDEPDNMVYKFYLGREYVVSRQFQSAVDVLEEAVLGLMDGGDGYFAETLKTLLTAYDKLNADPEKVIIMSDYGISKFPDQPDFWYFKGSTEVMLGRKKEGVENMIKALECLDSFQLVEVSQSHPIIGNMKWKVEEMVGEVLWELGRYKEAYPYYLRCFKHKPINSARWSNFMNSLCALAVEFNDIERMPIIFERLLLRGDTQLDLFFFRIEQLLQKNQVEEAQNFFKWGESKSSRLKAHPDFAQYQHWM